MGWDVDALIAEATIDCYGEDEQLTGLFTMIEHNLAVPFDTTVLGVPVTVIEVEHTVDGRIVAWCAEWVEAYRRRVEVSTR